MVTRVEEALAWAESVDKLLQCKKGQMVFGEFLKTEYSEENILFWLACEQYKKVQSISEMRATANRIYSEFVQVDAPRQINIDCGTREDITESVSHPTRASFDRAQRLIYRLMAKDSYPRFLKSDIYRTLLKQSERR
ncbi:regulator of G-protein signaling 21-like [Osmerus eperlanus]|uniref:regulator of G-protein signaling 21-like n=1 Tax=Osmerus eperlanus TaxID=29151 RepID=UPI002E139044